MKFAWSLIALAILIRADVSEARDVRIASCTAQPPEMEMIFEGTELTPVVESPSVEAVLAAATAGVPPDLLIDCPTRVIDLFVEHGLAKPWPVEIMAELNTPLKPEDNSWIPTSVDVGVVCLDLDRLRTDGFSDFFEAGIPAESILDFIDESAAKQALGNLMVMPNALSNSIGYNWFDFLYQTSADSLADAAPTLGEYASQIFVDASSDACTRVASGDAGMALSSWASSAAGRSISGPLEVKMPSQGVWLTPLVAAPLSNDPELVAELAPLVARFVNDEGFRDLRDPASAFLNVPQADTVALPGSDSEPVRWLLSASSKGVEPGTEQARRSAQIARLAQVATASATSCPNWCAIDYCNENQCQACAHCEN